jgi:hypothetical protein
MALRRGRLYLFTYLLLQYSTEVNKHPLPYSAILDLSPHQEILFSCLCIIQLHSLGSKMRFYASL